MPQFTLPNISSGGQITVNAPDLASAQQAAANQTGVSLGAQQAGGTFGGNTFGGGGGSAPGVAAPGSVAGTDLSGLQAFAAQTSGVTQAQLAQQKAEFDAQLNFAKQQMEQLGIPQLQINQQLAQLQQQQFQTQLALAQQAQSYNQAATTASLTGWFTPPAGVPNVSAGVGYPGQPPISGAGGGGAGGGTLAQYPAGTVVRTANNQFGVVGAGGSLSPGDVSNPSIYQAIQRGSGIVTIPDALFQAGSTGGGVGGGSSPLSQYNPGQVVRTANNQFGVIGPNGTLTAGDASNPAIYAAIQAGQGIATVPDAAFNAALSFQPAAPTAAGGTPTGGGAGGAQQTLAGLLQQAQLTGQYQGAPTEAASEFTRQLGLQQGQLGQQYLATAAQLQGPQNTFQLSNYLRGAQGNQAVPTYLQNLASNISNPMFQGTGSTPPTPQTAAGLAGQLGGTQSATPGWDYNQTLGTIQNIMGQGAQSLRPGALESLTPDELAALGSGLGAVGGSLPAFMQQYQQSRVGQQAPIARTSLA
jgi:hypothetical protein